MLSILSTLFNPQSDKLSGFGGFKQATSLPSYTSPSLWGATLEPDKLNHFKTNLDRGVVLEKHSSWSTCH